MQRRLKINFKYKNLWTFLYIIKTNTDKNDKKLLNFIYIEISHKIWKKMCDYERIKMLWSAIINNFSKIDMTGADYESRKIPTGVIFIAGKCPDPGQLLSTKWIEIFRAMMSIGSIWNDCPCGINWTIVLYDYYGYQNIRIGESRNLSRATIRSQMWENTCRSEI